MSIDMGRRIVQCWCIFLQSFKVFLQTKSVFFCQWEGQIRHSYLVVIWGSVSTVQWRCIYLQIIQSISYKNHLEYLSNRCKSIFVRKSGSATVILLLSEDQCPPKHLMYTCADNDAVWIFISWPCIPFLLS